MPLWLPILAPRLHDIPVTALAKPTTPSDPELILQCLAEGKGPSCREQNCTGLALAGLVWSHRAGQGFSRSSSECSASGLPSEELLEPQSLCTLKLGRGRSREVTLLL